MARTALATRDHGAGTVRGAREGRHRRGRAKGVEGGDDRFESPTGESPSNAVIDYPPNAVVGTVDDFVQARVRGTRGEVTTRASAERGGRRNGMESTERDARADEGAGTSTSRRTKTSPTTTKRARATGTGTDGNRRDKRQKTASIGGRGGAGPTTMGAKQNATVLARKPAASPGDANGNWQRAMTGSKKDIASNLWYDSMEAKMELEAFLGNAHTADLGELATRDSEDVFEPDLTLLNPFAPPKMASFSFSPLAPGSPVDLMPSTTRELPPVVPAVFDDWEDTQLYERVSDHLTSTSTSQYMQGRGSVPYTVMNFVGHQNEYRMSFGPEYELHTSTSLLDPDLLGSVKKEVEEAWGEGKNASNTIRKTTSGRGTSERSKGAHGTLQKSAQATSNVGASKRTQIRSKTSTATITFGDDHSGDKKKVKPKPEHSMSEKLLPGSLFLAEQQNQARRGTPAHGLNEVSSSTALPRVVQSRPQPNDEQYPSSSPRQDDADVISMLRKIANLIPSKTRDNIRSSLLRLKQSAVRQAERSDDAEVNPDDSYIDRSVANLLYHRYATSEVCEPTPRQTLEKAGREADSFTNCRGDQAVVPA